jgi:heme/copper-type cytochrome/quinol oxidase subunit 2
MIFLLSGIFWGQCMEVCGRYHHWMPIVVYFMKRDMFVLWCTHFVFYDTTTQQLKFSQNSSPIIAKPVSIQSF